MTQSSLYLTFLRQHGRDCVPDPVVPATEALLDAAFGDTTGHPFVAGLKARTREALAYFSAAPGLRPDILAGATRPDLPRTPLPVVLPSGTPAPKAVVAVMDDAVPFAQWGLADRLVSLWAQSAEPDATTAAYLPFGRDIRGAALTQAMTQAADSLAGPSHTCRTAVRPGRETYHRLHSERTFSHGAAVLGQITGRHDAATPAAPLIGVQFPPAVVRDTSGALLPFFAICGLLHVMDMTRQLAATLPGIPELPMIVNFSFGITAGAKDGTGVFESLLNDLADPRLRFPGLGPLHLVLPMGNGRQSQTHGVLGGTTGRTDLGFRLLPDDRTASYLEVYGNFDQDLGLTVTPPGSQTPVAIPGPGGWAADGSTAIPGLFAYTDTTRLRPRVLLAFLPSAPDGKGAPIVQAGLWSVGISEGAGTVWLFLQRDDSIAGLESGGRQPYFLDASYPNDTVSGVPIEFDPDPPTSPIRRKGTSNAYTAAKWPWSVGGIYARVFTSDVVPYSSQAYDGSFGDLMAISDRSLWIPGILSRSYQGTAIARINGTSLAAPQVTRALAQAIFDGVDARDHTALDQAVAAMLPQTEPFAAE